jgi:hypothetical protein
MFEPTQVAIAIDKFNVGAIEERLRYKPIYQVIEDYVANYASNTNDMIILGGTMSIDLLLGKELGRDDFVYNLFSENAFQHSNTLANLISEAVEKLFADNKDPLNKPYWTVVLKTTSAHRKFDISVDQRILVRWTVLQNMSKESSMFDLIQPLNVKSWFQKKTVLIMPPRFHLVETYRTLYSPSDFDNWQHALVDERRLFGYMKRIMDMQKAGKTVVVGRDEQDLSLAQKKAVAAALLDEFIKNNPKVILLGEHAINILTGSSIDTTIIHLLIDHDLSLKDIEPTIQDICSRALGRDARLFINTKNVQILSDFRLRRTSIKLDNKEIMYIYNATSYDLIPTNRIMDSSKNIILIGSPFVLIRFMLIELWVVNWIASIGKIEASFAKNRANSIISKILGLRSRISKKSTDTKHFKTSIDDKYLEPGPMQIMQVNSSSYMGQFESEDKAQKTKAQSLQRFHDYMPQEYIRKNGKYRVFGTKDHIDASS